MNYFFTIYIAMSKQYANFSLLHIYLSYWGKYNIFLILCMCYKG